MRLLADLEGWHDGIADTSPTRPPKQKLTIFSKSGYLPLPARLRAKGVLLCVEIALFRSPKTRGFRLGDETRGIGKDMSAIEAGVRAPENPWREEMRAMLQLSWPMILTRSRPDGDDGDRRAHDGPARAGCAGGGVARREPLFHAADLRDRPDDGGRADDRHRARPQAAFRARRAPHVRQGLSASPSWCRSRSGFSSGRPSRSSSPWARSRGLPRWPAPMCTR